MKNKKSGFTLAEVLITLSIIGIVAAITLPSVMSGYQYKSIGVKLAKFISTTEDSARAYAVANDSFSNTNPLGVVGFLNEAFVVKSLTGQKSDLFEEFYGESAKVNDYPTYIEPLTTALAANTNPGLMSQTEANGTIALLKDNTSIQVQMVTPAKFETHLGVVDNAKTGLPVFNINFNPMVTGLPSTVQRSFNFIVTELGFVFPNDSDTCLWDIYRADWVTNAKTFAEGTSCNLLTTKDDDKKKDK